MPMVKGPSSDNTADMAHAALTVTLHDLDLKESEPVRRITIRSPWLVKIGRCSQTEPHLRPAADNAWFSSRVMSREHAVIHADPFTKRITISDVGSMHGTFVNGDKLEAHLPVVLEQDEIVTFGADIVRGDLTYQALLTKVHHQWSDEYVGSHPIRRSTSLTKSRRPGFPPSTDPFRNTFTVDYSEDDRGSDNEVEFISQTTRKILDESFKPKPRIFSVPDSDSEISDAEKADDRSEHSSLLDEENLSRITSANSVKLPQLAQTSVIEGLDRTPAVCATISSLTRTTHKTAGFEIEHDQEETLVVTDPTTEQELGNGSATSERDAEQESYRDENQIKRQEHLTERHAEEEDEDEEVVEEQEEEEEEEEQEEEEEEEAEVDDESEDYAHEGENDDEDFDDEQSEAFDGLEDSDLEISNVDYSQKASDRQPDKVTSTTAVAAVVNTGSYDETESARRAPEKSHFNLGPVLPSPIEAAIQGEQYAPDPMRLLYPYAPAVPKAQPWRTNESYTAWDDYNDVRYYQPSFHSPTLPAPTPPVGFGSFVPLPAMYGYNEPVISTLGDGDHGNSTATAAAGAVPDQQHNGTSTGNKFVKVSINDMLVPQASASEEASVGQKRKADQIVDDEPVAPDSAMNDLTSRVVPEPEAAVATSGDPTELALKSEPEIKIDSAAEVFTMIPVTTVMNQVGMEPPTKKARIEQDPAPRLRSSRSRTFFKYTATALAGAAVGAVSTVFGLAALPAEYFN